MRMIARLVGIAAVLMALGGCAGLGSPNTPPFVTSDNLARLEVTNDQNGQKGVATKEADDLNVLLYYLHLGDLRADTRVDAPEPASPAYTIVAYDQTQVLWAVRVLDSPESSRVYLRDAVHPANSGIYPLKRPIRIADLDQFVRENPAH